MRGKEKKRKPKRKQPHKPGWYGVVSGVSTDGKGGGLAFMEPEQSVKPLKNVLSYDAAIKYMNKATATKPASLLIIDAFIAGLSR